jgi:hypothetical protein
MHKWIVRGIVAGVVAGVSYVAGRRKGGQVVARQMVADPKLGRRVIERLARVHGVELSELFEVEGAAAVQEDKGAPA